MPAHKHTQQEQWFMGCAVGQASVQAELECWPLLVEPCFNTQRNVASALCDSLSTSFHHHGSEGGEIFTFLSSVHCHCSSSSLWVPSSIRTPLLSVLTESFLCAFRDGEVTQLLMQAMWIKILVSLLKDCVRNKQWVTQWPSGRHTAG